MRRGLAVEYATLADLVAAIRAVRGRGFERIEAFSPVPSDAIDAALGARRSPFAIAAGIGALVGAASAYSLQWLLVAYLYPVDAGGRPPHMPLPFTIITVEMGFLFGALVVVVAFVIASRLFRLWDPIFEVPGFESASRAGFWLGIDAGDPKWDRDTVFAAINDTGATRAHGFGGIG